MTGFIWDCVQTGSRAIFDHLGRSMLTVIGIAAGVATIICSVGSVQGTFRALQRYIDETGGLQRIVVLDRRLPPNANNKAGLARGQTGTDISYALANLGGSLTDSPVVDLGRSLLRSQTGELYTTLQGVGPHYPQVEKFDLSKGRFISPLDVERRSRVMVIGREAQLALFGEDIDPVGRRVMFDDKEYTVIGVVSLYDYFTGNKQDLPRKNRICFMPYSTAQSYVVGHARFSFVAYEMAMLQHLDEIKARLRNLLQFPHSGLDDYVLDTHENELKNWLRLESSFEFTLGIISAVSLLVGGIGVTNVMLASINERTREIGTRRALGATRAQIVMQFLTESVVLSVLGGVVGVVLAMGFIPVMGNIMPPELPGEPVLVPSAVFIGLVFSLLVGIIAGMVPALRAGQLHPLEALRYE